MSKQKLIQTNFTGGELSPLMMGRVDTVKYQNGAATIKNMLVRQQGGCWKREGSKFVAEVKNSANATILIDFEYSDAQPYVLEFGNLYIRVYYDGGFVETAPASGIPLEITTLYTTAQLPEITYTQSADVLYVFHPSHPVRKVRRLGANSWDIVNCDFQDGPYLTNQPVECDLKISDLYNYATATSTVGIFNAVISLNRSITAVTYNAGVWEFTTNVNHGFSTGWSIGISGVGFQVTVNGVNRFIYINGKYAITALAAPNKFKITTPPGWFPTDAGTTWTFGSSLCQRLTGTGTVYVDYSVNGLWKLAEIITVTDNTHATVRVVENIKNIPFGTGLIWWGNGNVLEGTASGMFTTNDIGSYVRDTQNAAWNWWLITSLVSDSDVGMGGLGTNLPMLSYTYSTTLVTVTEPLRLGLVTASANLFASTDVGRLVRFNYGGSRPWAVISVYLSATTVLIEPETLVPLDPSSLANLFNNGITSLWQLGAWSVTTGYPRVGVFHEQRLWAGGTVTEPMNVWASQPADFENMAPTAYDSVVTDSNAINYTIVSNKANPIQWMSSGATLMIGTYGAEWQVKAASSVNQPITPTNINITEQTVNGSLRTARPVRLNNVVCFLQKAGKKFIEIVYDFQQDSMVARNMTIVSEHILRRGGRGSKVAYQQEPNNIIWVMLTDGTLAACTYDRDQQVMAWHQHALGGNGIVESLVAVNSTAGTETLIYMIVRRTINGGTKRYIEYLTPDFFPISDTDIADGFFLDCGLTYDGAPATNITGLNHLNGETIDVVADGIYLGTQIVTANAITLTTAASVVHVGYKYSAILRTLPQEGGSPSGGTSQGKIKRAARTMVRVMNTREFKYGTNLQTLDVRKIVDGNGVVQNKMNSDDLGVNIPMNYNYTAQFYLVQDLPYPMVILAIAPDVEVTA